MFETYLQRTLKYEGGFVDDPDDPGGRTNKGITQKTYDTYRESKQLVVADVKYIEYKELEEIYKQYWDACSCDKIDLINNFITHEVFDFGVTSGPQTSIKTLQKILGCTRDGIYGPITEKALINETSRIGGEGLSRLFAYQRIKFYTLLAIRRPRSCKFLLSWITRSIESEEDRA